MAAQCRSAVAMRTARAILAKRGWRGSSERVATSTSIGYHRLVFAGPSADGGINHMILDAFALLKRRWQTCEAAGLPKPTILCDVAI